ncbi:CCR3 [Symbiodinium microadriaticum]|nr:CCR3 [Symbiodinium microadriaticum]
MQNSTSQRTPQTLSSMNAWLESLLFDPGLLLELGGRKEPQLWHKTIWPARMLGQQLASPGRASGFRASASRLWSGAYLCAGLRSDEHQRSSGSPSGRFVSIAASGGHSCALKKNGYAVCWGFNDNNQTDVPNKAKFKQIAPGYLRTCALTLQDEVLCWGQRRGDNKPPPGRFKQVSSRGPFSCALDMAGRAVCWPQAEQRDDHFVHISVGGSHFCGVQESGRVKCRGKDDQGQSSPPSGFFKLPTKKTQPKSTEL